MFWRRKHKSVFTSLTPEIIHQQRCERLGVEDFEVDWLKTEMRDPDETRMNSSSAFGSVNYSKEDFRCPVVRWKVDGKWLVAAIPLHLVEHTKSDIIGHTTRWKEDWHAMEDALREIIDRAKKYGPDEIL